jgi:hypothetical protein
MPLKKLIFCCGMVNITCMREESETRRAGANGDEAEKIKLFLALSSKTLHHTLAAVQKVANDGFFR